MRSRGARYGRVRRCGVTETPPGRVRVAGSGTAVGAVAAAAMLVAAAAVAWFGRTAALYLVVVLTASATGIIVTLVRNRQDPVLLDDAGLTVVTRSGRVTHRWEDVLEVGWLASVPLLPPQRPGLLVRPAAGGPFSVPGPNQPTRVATLAVYGRRARRRVCDQVASACACHGVPFTANGLLMMTDAPPGSPYRVPRHPRRFRS